ncbi:hypothetical protein P170DRAFT_470873 [Aspergillus steynii IBT 23096]|uniref:Protein Zds1 C-terminal domain-containing protein n=1 Tax=Aspergillus steynii IBT 23096 TaxID=1392250 RepID=A0A2I2GRF4_9EURO|nr:uncharacterized protein P170DRAFT_470873 [Aspergillus steynii IBT 23096]PLB55459.1 hypothetical protein P170DRAFT_470873 [Aspergillus steynii IBT 23096]
MKINASPSPSPSEVGGGYATRRGHVPHLSISDPSHHVTEAIGHMYEDDYDKRESKRLSYLPSPLTDTISIIPPKLAGAESPSSPQSLQVQSHLNEINNNRQTNGQSRPSAGAKSLDNTSPTSPSSTTSPGSTDTATTSFPLNDIDYESDPAAVAQELNNLAAIRRMSMDVAATGDPDLPSFNPNLSVPSMAPSPSADENDASRLFWVPARLHPELAPKEFKSFLESKADHIKRKSGDYSTLGPERQGSTGGLRRKKSMLSRQIDSSQGYTDGAERLERKRSKSSKGDGPNLLELETLVDDSIPRSASSSLLSEMRNLDVSEEDRPILPPAPPGHSLRRSTRTQYRKAGSLKKGEKAPYSKRLGRTSDSSEGASPFMGEVGLSRVSTDPTPSATRAQALAKTAQPTASASDEPVSSAVGSNPEQQHFANEPSDESSAESRNRSGSQSQSRQWHSRISSNGRSTLHISPTEQKIPEIIETPPLESTAPPELASPQSTTIPSRGSSYDPPPSAPPAKVQTAYDQPSSKRSQHSRSHGKESTQTFNEFASTPQALPGNTTRTDSLSFIPTFSDDRKSETKSETKSESKKSKDKKDSEGGRKSSWHWLLGSEDKEKEKDKKKDKDDSKKIKSKIVDKVHETAHSLPISGDSNQRGRESIVVDRLDPKLEEERRKDHVRRTSGESKKEKESGLFSSIFGGGRKKASGDSHHKKSASRTLSPDPPVRELRPDVDFPWTRFSILEERAIYRMAHIKLANPRRALYSQVLLSNFMYSYLAKVQQMHPLMLASSAQQRQQKTQAEEYLQYQRYQEAQEQQQYSDGGSYDDHQMYDYHDDPHDQYRTQSRGGKQGYENGNVYGPGHHQYGHSSFGDDAQLDDDDDDMW